MKIFILPVEKKFQSKVVPHAYPAHNKDYGIEQDFLDFLSKNEKYLVDNPEDADWHYLPVFWTRWHVAHDHAASGRSELSGGILKSVINANKTFTICQYADGPVIDLGEVVVFLGSRKNAAGLDVSLLSNPHKRPFFRPRKRYLASFVGRINTHEIRKTMVDLFKDRTDVFIFDGNRGSRFFVKKILQSYIALCPRGYGGGSFRFYEAMQLGVVPFLIGDVDIRPFKDFIAWDEISFYVKSPERMDEVMDRYTRNELLEIGKKAETFYSNNFLHQRWCEYVIKSLAKKRDEK